MQLIYMLDFQTSEIMLEDSLSGRMHEGVNNCNYDELFFIFYRQVILSLCIFMYIINSFIFSENGEGMLLNYVN